MIPLDEEQANGTSAPLFGLICRLDDYDNWIRRSSSETAVI
jgi:hypothetical protein